MMIENTVAVRAHRLDDDVSGDCAPLSNEELIQLRSLLKVLDYDRLQKAFVIKNGQSRIVAREDGTIRIEGKSVTTQAQGAVRINGAIVELN